MGNRKTMLLAVALVLVLLLLLLWWEPGLPGGPEAPGAEAPGADPFGETELLPLTLPAATTMPDATGRSPTVRRSRPLPANGSPPSTASFGIPPLMPGEPSLGTKEKVPVWLTGVLTGPDGEPLEGVTVRLEPELDARIKERKNRRTGLMERVLDLQLGHMATLIRRCGRMMAKGRYVGETDAQGRFEIPAPGTASRYHVTFHPAGKAGAYEFLLRTGPYRYRPGKKRSLGVLRRPRGGMIRGVVVDEAGKPVGGASVSYWPDGYGVTRESLLPPGQAPADRISVQGTGTTYASYRHGLGRVETDEKGRFELREVTPGTCSLFAVAPGSTKVVTAHGYRLHDREEIDGVRIVAARADPPLVAGRVVDDVTGKPVRALIRVSVDWTYVGRFHRCREDGSFLIGSLPTSKVRLTVRADGYKTGDAGPFTFGPQERKTGLKIRLIPAPK